MLRLLSIPVYYPVEHPIQLPISSLDLPWGSGQRTRPRRRHFSLRRWFLVGAPQGCHHCAARANRRTTLFPGIVLRGRQASRHLEILAHWDGTGIRQSVSAAAITRSPGLSSACSEWANPVASIKFGRCPFVVALPMASSPSAIIPLCKARSRSRPASDLLICSEPATCRTERPSRNSSTACLKIGGRKTCADQRTPSPASVKTVPSRASKATAPSPSIRFRSFSKCTSNRAPCSGE